MAETWGVGSSREHDLLAESARADDEQVGVRVLEADERAQLRALCARTARARSVSAEWGVSERAWARP